MIRIFLDSIMANHFQTPQLSRGLSFASTPLYLYVDDLQDSFIGIAAA
jgi:hypothetical protein